MNRHRNESLNNSWPIRKTMSDYRLWAEAIERFPINVRSHGTSGRMSKLSDSFAYGHKSRQVRLENYDPSKSS